MAISEQFDDRELEGELVTVAEAAGARLRAETDQDADASRGAAEALVSAASAAMAAGHSLTAIASAEAHGKETVRQALRGDALKLVGSTGEQARAMRAEHYQAIARATRLGLAMREIAQAAGVAHGTIRAINNRLASGSSPDLEIDPSEEGHPDDAAEPVDAEA